MEKYLEIGRFVGTHGIKGEVKLEVWADTPEFIRGLKTLYFEEGKVKIDIESKKVHKNVGLVKIKGIDTPEQGEALRGKLVYMDRSEVRLPKNRFFIADLIGIKVYDGNNEKYYGEITEVFQTGANNVYKIEKDGKEYLFPAVDHMIKSTDIENSRIEVLPIAGIFDDEGYTDEN